MCCRQSKQQNAQLNIYKWYGLQEKTTTKQVK